MKGDSDDYKNPEFDDSKWDVTSFPSSWTHMYPGWDGICWYRFHIKFPETLQHKSYGVSLGMIINSDETYFNGRLIGKTGDCNSGRIAPFDKTRLYEISPALIRPGKDNVISMRVRGLYSETNGPTAGNFEMGPFNEIQSRYLAVEFTNIFFVIFYLAVGFYILLFFFRVTKDREYLFFSLFVITTAIYIFFRSEVKYFIFNNALILKKMEYLSLILLFVLLLLFIIEYFDKQYTKLHIAFFILSGIFFIINIFNDNNMLRVIVLFYGIQPSWIIPIGYIIYYFIKDFNNSKEKRFLFYSLMIVLLTSINDIMISRNMYDFIFLARYSFMFIVIGITVVLYKLFTALYYESQNRKSGSRQTGISSALAEKLELAAEYIKEKYNTEISREEIAAKLDMNPETLGKMFKKHTGMTIIEYKNDLRIKEALRLLKNTDHLIIDIAYTVGFESLATFYRIFQKSVGCPPNSIREKNGDAD
jgi:AraC-like DNA-binding protein